MRTSHNPLDDLQTMATSFFKEFPCVVKKEGLLYFVADGVIVQ